jgi:hypothetical protein
VTSCSGGFIKLECLLLEILIIKYANMIAIHGIISKIRSMIPDNPNENTYSIKFNIPINN